MKAQKLLSYLRQAIEDYHMIEENDVIAVGLSGGKDSLTLLFGLAYLKRFYPKPFSLKAITVDLGFSEFDTSSLQKFCDDLDIEYIVEKTQIAEIVFEMRKEKNPCSLCSKMRKGTVNEVAVKAGCNKIAYAHHNDDVIDTMLLSLIFEGRFHTFSPVTQYDELQLTLIRPLIYAKEYEIASFSKMQKFPISKNPCPMDKHSKREYTRQLLYSINKDFPGARKRMFTAISNSNIDGWSSNKKDSVQNNK